MDKLKRLLKKTPPVPFGIAGALLVLLVFYTLAFRTPLWQVGMPPYIDNDEVIYNRQVVSVIAHGGPLGYLAITKAPPTSAATVPGARCLSGSTAWPDACSAPALTRCSGAMCCFWHWAWWCLRSPRG